MDAWNDLTKPVPERFAAAATAYRDELVGHGFTPDAATAAATEFRGQLRVEADGRVVFVEKFTGQPAHSSVDLQQLAYRRSRDAGAGELALAAPREPTADETAAAVARSASRVGQLARRSF